MTDQRGDPLVYTVAEAASALRVSQSYVRKLVTLGRIEPIAHMGRRVLIARSELERVVNERGAA